MSKGENQTCLARLNLLSAKYTWYGFTTLEIHVSIRDEKRARLLLYDIKRERFPEFRFTDILSEE